MRAARHLVFAFALASLGTLTAACAAEEAKPLPPVPATTPELSKDAFLERANRVCSDAEKRITELTNQHGPVNNNSGNVSDAELRTLVDQIRPVGQNAIDQLKSLTPPADAAGTVQQGIGQMQKVLDDAQKDVHGLLDPIGQTNRDLYLYGLISCFSAE